MKQTYLTSLRSVCFSYLLLLFACSTPYQLASVTGSKTAINSAWDDYPNEKVAEVFAPYKAKVDSIMTPVVGRNAMDMQARRPESLLSNLVADVLRESAPRYFGVTADMGLINVGGLRNSLNKGDITYADIFEILPFDNSLCLVTMRGDLLKELMENIASARGEGVSNVQLVITKDRKLVDCKIGGKPIDPARMYKVATIDYLAEGNDRMTAFRKAEDKKFLPTATIRNVFLEYVQELTRQGKEITSVIEGRIVVSD